MNMPLLPSRSLPRATRRGNPSRRFSHLLRPSSSSPPSATPPAETTVTCTSLMCTSLEQGSVHSSEKRGNTQELVPSISELCKVEVHPVADRERIFLREEKVKPKLASGDVDSKKSTWYLDSGASNHMTGSRESFVVLDESIKGSVKFGDD